MRPILNVIQGHKTDATGDVYAQDHAFAKAIARGDSDAARAFTLRCLPQVHGVAMRMLGNASDAEDVAQETFIRVWRKAHQWKPGKARFESWVVRIAINLCYDRLRKKREVLGEDIPEMVDPSPSAGAAMVEADTSAEVQAVIAALPERQRLALELCHFQDYSNIQAAEIMEVSVEALESLLARARRSLKAALAESVTGLMADFNAAKGE